jgi:hypothetical protein
MYSASTTNDLDLTKTPRDTVNMGKLALTSATGKLGSAVLNAILDNNLISTKDLVVCVSLHESTQIINTHNTPYRHLPIPPPTS